VGGGSGWGWTVPRPHGRPVAIGRGIGWGVARGHRGPWRGRSVGPGRRRVAPMRRVALVGWWIAGTRRWWVGDCGRCAVRVCAAHRRGGHSIGVLWPGRIHRGRGSIGVAFRRWRVAVGSPSRGRKAGDVGHFFLLFVFFVVVFAFVVFLLCLFCLCLRSWAGAAAFLLFFVVFVVVVAVLLLALPCVLAPNSLVCIGLARSNTRETI